MGSSSSSPLDIVAGVATGGLYTIGKYAHDKKKQAERAARTAADQQKDAMIAQENELKQKQKQERKSAGNLAMRQRLIAQRGYASSARNGTIFSDPTGSMGGGTQKRLLGE